MGAASSELLILGRIAGIYGVRGWVKVWSYTEPRENILEYSPWQVRVDGEWRMLKVVEGRAQGKGVVAHVESYADRDQVRELIGADIAVTRDQLPALKRNEYYWADLEGLRVVNHEGVELGVISHLFETGANDVMVVAQDKRERLIPYLWGRVVTEVDLEQRFMRVDWDAEF